MTLRSILCPVDFSDHSRHALRLAWVLATRYESRLIVLNVVDPLLAEAATMRLGLDLAKEETEPALGEFVRQTWPGARNPHPVLTVRVGDAPGTILETAEKDVVDLIVMGTQGLGGLRKWLLGSTTERVLRRTHRPVLAVPLPGVAASSADVPFDGRPIVAATDFSESATAAVKYASDLAEQLAVPLLLVHIVEPVAVAPQWRAYLDESDQTRLADGRARLTELAGQLSAARRPEVIVSLGRPADAIAALAEERRAGLIVVGLMGDHGPFARRPGSIAYHVLCCAGVPALVVPAPVS